MASDPKWSNLVNICVKLYSRVMKKKNNQQKAQLFRSIVNSDSNEYLLEMVHNDKDAMEEVNRYAKKLVSKRYDENKGQERSMASRRTGNKYLIKRRYKEALQSFSEAVSFAPDTSQELAFAFGCRSAAFYALKDYNSCINDIELAFTHNYPVNCKLILDRRLLSCIQKLQQTGCELPMNYRNKFSDVPQDLNHLISPQNIQDLEISNPLMSNDSPVEMKFSTIKGRHFVASEKISTNTTLFVEKPFACILKQDLKDEFCHHCLLPLPKSFYPCHKCAVSVKFCSQKCGLESWNSYHKYECCNISVLQNLGFGHLAIRLMLVGTIEEAIQLINTKSMPQDPVSQEHTCNYKSVFSLVDHIKDHEPDQLFSFMLGSALITSLIRKMFLDKSLDRNIIGAILLKHILQLICNTIQITYRGADKIIPIGSGIYPVVSLLNHACHSILNSSCKGSYLTLKTGKPLKAGDEITFCYGPHYKISPRNIRWKMLQEQYFFDCLCKRCKSEAKKNDTLSCVKCKAPGIWYEDRATKCKSCGYKLKLKKLLEIKRKIAFNFQLYDYGSALMKAKRYEEAKEKFLKSEAGLVPWLSSNHKQLLNLKFSISLCFKELKNYDQAVFYAVDALNISKEVSGNKSFDFAECLFKIFYLRIEAAKSSDNHEKTQYDLKKAEKCYNKLLIYKNWLKYSPYSKNLNYRLALRNRLFSAHEALLQLK